MRAAHVVAHGRAPRLVEIAPPVRPDGHCLIATTAVPITPLDVLCATGESYFGAPALPYVPGVQGVGIVLESEAVAAGTPVWFPTSAGMQPGDGSLAERAVAPDADVIPLPAGVPAELVAALGLSSVAAWMSVAVRGGLRAGEVVLVLGAGGVVGQVAVQLARLLGAGRVVAAARSAESRRLAGSYGADAVVELRDGDDVAGLAARMSAACGGAADLVIDPLCGVPASAAARVLGTGGRLVNLGGSAAPTAEFDSAALRSRSASILGYTNNALTDAQRREALSCILDHVLRDGVTVSHEVVDWEDGPAGWERQARGTARRRVVIRVGSAG
jgi:NADPH:quinone reductase-like Zn-dependent oxidoreductase